MTEVEIIKRVLSVLDENKESRSRYNSEIENFKNRLNHAKQNKYRLGVVGVTSGGKSTMINSLLGEALLPAVARPSSSQLVSCYHSKEKLAKVYFEDGRIKNYSSSKSITEAVKQYGDENYNRKNREKVKQIELTTPDFPFAENIVLIDSPGLDAYGYEGHEQLTMNSLLPTLDFCMFVTTCKTNSDEKMLSVLNTLAAYEKPVIIVQNMIDSLKPGLDGKSVAEVAQDHVRRIERIINRSNIADKSKVHIVQISAINALKARSEKLRNKASDALLASSNYSKLISSVTAAFNQVLPIVENHRLKILKKEILRIYNAAREDGKSGSCPVKKFEYQVLEEDYNKSKQRFLSKLTNSIQSLARYKDEIQNKTNFTENDVRNVKQKVSTCESVICQQMQAVNHLIVGLCDRLNVDSRSILTDFRMDKSDFSLSKKNKTVRSGYWIKGKRHWYTLWLVKDDDVWVPPVVDVVTDVHESIKRALRYIDNTAMVFKQAITRWERSLEFTEEKLFAEIDNRFEEYKARVNKALECKVYLLISDSLKEIADSIKVVDQKHTQSSDNKTEVKNDAKYTIRVSEKVYSIYKIAEKLRFHIHQQSFSAFVGNRQSIIWGWDEFCESRFLMYHYGIRLNPGIVKEGCNRIRPDITLCHKVKGAKFVNTGTCNVFILINATQFGAALTEIANSKIADSLRGSDHIYMVIQDFAEIINGDAVEETLDNMKSIQQKINLRIGYKILLLHENPLFNLAAIEAQHTACTTHFDEVRINNQLQTSFPFLYPENRMLRNNYDNIINQILKKLG